MRHGIQSELKEKREEEISRYRGKFGIYLGGRYPGKAEGTSNQVTCFTSTTPIMLLNSVHNLHNVSHYTIRVQPWLSVVDSPAVLCAVESGGHVAEAFGNRTEQQKQQCCFYCC